MSSSPSVRQPRRRFKSLIRHEVNESVQSERIARNVNAFTQVFETYCELRATAPLGAFNLDPTARRNGLSSVHVEFLADVDKCVQSTLQSFQTEKFDRLIDIELQYCTDEEKRAAKKVEGISPQVE